MLASVTAGASFVIGHLVGPIAASVRGLTGRFSRLPLRWQIGGLVLVGLVTVFVLFGWLGSAIAEDGRHRTVNDWLSVTRSTAGFLDTELDEQFERLERVAVILRMQARSPEAQRAVLSETLGQPESFISGAFLLDSQDAIVWSQPEDSGELAGFLAGHREMSGPLRTQPRYASGVFPLGEAPAAILAVPLTDASGRGSGTLGEVVRPGEGLLNDMVAGALGLARTGHAELVDQNGLVIASSEPGHALGPAEHPGTYGPLLAQHRGAVSLTGPVSMAGEQDAGQRHVMAFVPLNTVPWGLALGGSEAELAADTNRWQREIGLFGGIALALALALVWLTTRGVARPIETLTAASRRIAAGDLSTPIPREGEGEVRILAEAFDDMRTDLQTALSRLQRALSELAVEKSRYEGIVGSMADAVITTDPQLNITAFNPAASALTGWLPEEALGRPCCAVLCSEKSCPPLDECTDCSLRGEPTFGVSKHLLRARSGRPVQLAITRSAIRDASGQLAGVVHVLRDISAEEELSRLKDEFLSTISHELRTPLGFIKGYALTPLLPDAPDDPATVRHCLKVIAEASDELEELVGNLLDMTKIGAGSLSVSPAPTELRPLVTAALERSRLRSQEHQWRTLIPASLPPVLADVHRVEQVLYNLLDNAAKYSPDGGRIAVTAERAGAEVVVSVVDQGMGVPADEVPTLFERFHRGRLAREQGIGGTGLGLAICKGIVEAHGGRIWAESPVAASRPAVSHGTAIRFTLPVASRLRRARRMSAWRAAVSASP